MLLKSNIVNQLLRDTIIFQEQEIVTHICLILKGRITVKSEGSKIVLTQGNIIGIPDLYIGRYLCDYIASEDTVIYPFSVTNVGDLDEILNKNKEYHGLMITSLTNQIRELNRVQDNLSECADQIFSFVSENYRTYIDYANQCNIPAKAVSDIDKLKPYSTDFTINSKVQQFFLEVNKIPADHIKSFYGSSRIITQYHMEEAAGLIAQQMIECMELTSYINELFSIIMNHSERGLFIKVVQMYLQLKGDGIHSAKLMDMVDDMVDEINRVDLLCEQYTNKKLPINRDSLEKMYCALLSGAMQGDATSQVSKLSQPQIMESLHDSLKQILDYSLLEKDKSIKIQNAIDFFLNVSDRLSNEEAVRACRKEICDVFYELYLSVFTVAYETKEYPKAVELFLNFGFLDERLLTKDQLDSLCTIKTNKEQSIVPVYTLYEWLTLIYEGKREPSKNELDMDYTDYLRYQRKTGGITETEEQRLLMDRDSKLEYEVRNMFRINHKLVNGQISTFVPCLYREIFINWPEKELLTIRRLTKSFEHILSIDSSAFYRELMYSNENLGIAKEYIQKEIFPEMILLPTAGNSASMWQEISGKRRTNPGRFLFPIFLNTNLDDIMIRLFGRFRWELCRCVMGTAWNNIKHKSLTSEYMDYLQFYHKNHDLSEERKEKLKQQIQKGRNNSREVFVLDYEAWMKGEANGAIRLNKVAREILATYCPFSKDIRTRLGNQPMFADAFARFQRETAKKVHEYELRILALQKEKIEPAKEIIDTLNFFRNL